MYIYYFELRDYHRLRLNAIMKLILTPEAITQLILGTNGSGKSSMLAELSPLPAILNNGKNKSSKFGPDGYKLIKIKHKGCDYVLRSGGTEGPLHSFIKDGVELNLGGKITTQYQLVKQDFGITPEIHTLLIGHTTFTQMSIGLKKQWLSELADIDYTFANRSLNRMKEKHRDLVGAIKNVTSRLLTEKSKLDSSDINALEQRYANLIARLDTLLASSKRVDPFKSGDAIQTDYLNKVTLTKKQYVDLQTYPKHMVSATMRNKAEKIGFTLLVKRESLTKHINQLAIDIDLLRAKADNTAHANIHTTNMSETIAALTTQNAYIKSHLKYITDVPSPIHLDELSSQLNVVREVLPTYLDGLLPNPDKHISRASMQQTETQIATLKTLISSIRLELDITTRQHTSMASSEQHNTAECPKCEHKWVVGFDANVFADLAAKKESLKTTLTQKEQLLLGLQNSLGEALSYFAKYKEVVALSKTYKHLSDIWRIVLDEGLILKAPDGILPLLDMVGVDIDSLKLVNQNILQIVELNKHLQHNLYLESSEYASNKEALNKLEATLDANVKALRIIEDALQRVKIYTKHYDTYTGSLVSLNKDEQGLLKHFTMEADNAFNQALNDAIRTTRLEKSTIEHSAITTRARLANITTLEKELDDLKHQATDTKLLISATYELISAGMLNFVNEFIDKMNAIMETVWSYPLKILPCGLDKTNTDSLELDYKFDYLIDDTHQAEEGSTSIKEITDLAFKLVVMIYLGITDYPIYLDELGRSFDSTHRKMVFDNVHQLALANHFEQIFIVSHFEDCYSGLQNTDVHVIAPLNVTIPAGMVVNNNLTLA